MNMQKSLLILAIGMIAAVPLQANASCGTPNGTRLAASSKLPLLSSSAAGLSKRHNSIVGLWHVTYRAPDGSEAFESFDQWHGDGNEFEAADLAPGAVCQGTWTQIAPGTVRLFHVGWNFDLTGKVIGYFTEVQINSVSGHGSHYQGTFDLKNFDLNGNPDPNLGEQTGTLSAVRITVNG